MTYHPDDRPDPSEQPIRARVPEHVAGGCFSTGVIVMTAQTEFVLDFVQNLGRPHQIVSRVVMPHSVLPQLVDALGRNIQLYRGRWGELPQPRMVPGSTQQIVSPGFPAATPPPAAPMPPVGTGPVQAEPLQGPSGQNPKTTEPIGQIGSGQAADQSPSRDAGQAEPPHGASGSASGTSSGSPADSPRELPSGGPVPPGGPVGGASGGSSPPPQPTGSAAYGQPVRQTTAQDIYDDLKIRDELLSGVYANAVMIGHGPHEFSFDFITNFYPHSAVSARVFLAAGQIPRLYESLRSTWDQLRMRMQPPPPGSPPPG